MRVSSYTVFLFSSTLAVIYGQGANAQDDCGSQGTCAACIRSPNCAWCEIKVHDVHATAPQRCVDQTKAKPDWCSQGKKWNPITEGNSTENLPFSSPEGKTPVQIQPQVYKMRIRRGGNHSFILRYKQAKDYPVDLYVVADLSYTMEKFWRELAQLSKQIIGAMKKLTSDFRLGFGSFIDKSIRPMVRDKPGRDSRIHYAFRNHQTLTNDTASFQAKAAHPRGTGNDDDPESGFDALMQAMVCKKEIGWRADARHLLVYVTDDVPHIAGDGRFAGLLEPNDEKCHMNEAGYYTAAELQDYPSIGQIKYQAKENNVNIIFAVTENFKTLYNGVKSMIPGSAVGIFSKTSNHTAKLISNHYEKLVKSLKMTSNLTSKFLDVNFFSKCLNKNGKLKPTDQCDGIRVNDIIEFEVVIKVLDCPENKEDWHQIIQIKPEGISEDLIVDIELICDCECTLTGDKRENAARPEQCHRHGILECGICSCDPGYRGDTCQCEGDQDLSNTDNSLENCRIDNSSNICSDNGKCICGSCDCNKQLNSEQHFYGKFCQCNDFSCPYSSDGKLCGEHGRCKCGECVCDSGWGGPVCACRDDESFCRPPGVNAKVCSGFGRCECGQCICDKEKRRNGRFCEDCPSCSSHRCDEFKDCVECKIHNSGKIYAEDPTCFRCPEDITSVDEIEEDPDKIEPGVHVCRIAADDGSTFVFTYTYDNDELSDIPMIIAEKEKEFRVIDDFLAATLGVVFLTLLLGLLIIVIWKISTSMHDKKEFNKFMKDRAQVQWGTGENPLFREAVTTFKNPAFDCAPENDEL